MKQIYPVVCLCASLLGVSACGPSPHLHATNRVINAGMDVPESMRNQHVAGMVAFDEQWAGDYGRVARNALYSQGIAEGDAEYGYRIARVNLTNPGSFLFWESGSIVFPTAAVVPDHLPRLMAEDIVEIRQTGTWDTVKNFSRSREGNVVVRVLCRKASNDYEACRKNGPSVGRHAGVGPTFSPYPSKVSAYGHSYSVWFDAKGRKLREYPR